MNTYLTQITLSNKFGNLTANGPELNTTENTKRTNTINHSKSTYYTVNYIKKLTLTKAHANHTNNTFHSSAILITASSTGTIKQ